MSTISTNSNKAGRAVETNVPNVLSEDLDLTEVINLLGEDVAKARLQAQLTIDFRGKIRGMLEAEADGEAKYSDNEIQDADWSDWVPELRKRKTAADKAAELFAGMSPEEIAALLANAGVSVGE